jgi:endogenous inhibitor of DNA gyrase (YacG/DUF329 family)
MAERFLCPTCKKPVLTGTKEFPFCSERCRLLDLGRWLNEDYRISRSLRPAGLEGPPEEEEDESPPSSGDPDGG